MFRLIRLGDFVRSIKPSQFQVPLRSERKHSNFLPGRKYVSKTQLKVNHCSTSMMSNLDPINNSLKPLVSRFSTGLSLLFHSKTLLRSNQTECECEDFEDEGPNKDGTKIWRALTLYVCLPAILAGSVLVWRHEQEPHKRPEFVPYDHLRIRTRPFPWGDGNHSFFHNKCMNALPEGYEEDEEGTCHSGEHGTD